MRGSHRAGSWIAGSSLVMVMAVVLMTGFAGVASARSRAKAPVVVVTPSSPGVRYRKSVSLSFAGSKVAKGKVRRITINWRDHTPLQRVKSLKIRPKHVFQGAGSFTVKVAVTDAKRHTGRASAKVLVQLSQGIALRPTTVVTSASKVQQVLATGPTTKQITFAPGVKVTVGKVIVAAASPALPDGLLQVVTSVRRTRSGATVADTHHGTMEDAYSYYSVSAHGSLGQGNAFLVHGSPPADYHPAGIAARMARVARLARRSNGPRAHAALSFGDFVQAAFDCKSNGLAGTPVVVSLGISPDTSRVHFSSTVSPLGKTLSVEGPLVTTIHAGIGGEREVRVVAEDRPGDPDRRPQGSRRRGPEADHQPDFHRQGERRDHLV